MNAADALLVRPVQAQDAAAEQAFVSGLSASSRYRRFHIALRELPPSLLRAMTEVDQQRHVAFVAQTPDGHIIADARYVHLDEAGHDAEFALAVADSHQRHGVGRAMLQRLMQHAREHGVRRLVGDVLWDNAPMLAMVRALGGKLVANADNVSVLQARFETRSA
jgi:acetyltransferase